VTSGVPVVVEVCEVVAEPSVRLKFLCNNKWRISSSLAFLEFKTRVLSHQSWRRMKFLCILSPVLSTVVGAALTPCCMGLLHTWLVRGHQPNISIRVTNSVPKPLPVSTRISSKPMSVISSHCPTWSVRLLSVPCDMNQRALAPKFRTVSFSKGTLIKMSVRSKNG